MINVQDDRIPYKEWEALPLTPVVKEYTKEELLINELVNDINIAVDKDLSKELNEVKNTSLYKALDNIEYYLPWCLTNEVEAKYAIIRKKALEVLYENLDNILNSIYTFRANHSRYKIDKVTNEMIKISFDEYVDKDKYYVDIIHNYSYANNTYERKQVTN